MPHSMHSISKRFNEAYPMNVFSGLVWKTVEYLFQNAASVSDAPGNLFVYPKKVTEPQLAVRSYFFRMRLLNLHYLPRSCHKALTKLRGKVHTVAAAPRTIYFYLYSLH